MTAIAIIIAAVAIWALLIALPLALAIGRSFAVGNPGVRHDERTLR